MSDDAEDRTPHSYTPASSGLCIFCGKLGDHPNHSESWT